jgi:hypothetical protein
MPPRAPKERTQVTQARTDRCGPAAFLVVRGWSRGRSACDLRELALWTAGPLYGEKARGSAGFRRLRRCGGLVVQAVGTARSTVGTDGWLGSCPDCQTA